MKKLIKLDYFKTTEEFVTNIILVNSIDFVLKLDFEVKIQKINKGEKIKNWIKNNNEKTFYNFINNNYWLHSN